MLGGNAAFKSLSFRDVAQYRNAPTDDAGVVLERPSTDTDPATTWRIRRSHKFLDFVNFFAANSPHDRHVRRGNRSDPIGHVDIRDTGRVGWHSLLRLDAHDFPRHWVETQKSPLLIGNDDSIRHACKDRLEDRRMFEQFMLGLREFACSFTQLLVEA